MTIEKLRDERLNLVKNAETFLNEKGEGISGDDLKQWESMHQDIEAKGAEIQALEEAQQKAADARQYLDNLKGDSSKIVNPLNVGASAASPIPVGIEGIKATERFGRALKALVDGDTVQARDLVAPLSNSGIKFIGNGFTLQLPNRQRSFEEIKDAQSTTRDGSGGETVPIGFVNNLEKAMLYYGPMRQVSDVMRTASGNPLEWPTVNDTGNKGVILAENTQDTEQDVAFAQTVFGAFKYTSKIVRVSYELLQDSAFNMAAELGTLLGERIGRAQNEHFTVGAGTTEPTGIVTAAATVTAAAAGAIDFDDLYGLKHGVDVAYRNGAGFMMADSSLLAVKKLKDSEGRYLWQASTAAGSPDTIDGDPVYINNDVAAIGASAKSVVYGQLSKYKIREAREITLIRMVERYADFHQHGFVAFARADGNLLDAGTNPVKVLEHPAS